jgi:protein-S-isoprenylcysteine O-methyltransferase Ste14
MSTQVESTIILTTWVALLLILYVSQNFVKRRFLKDSPNVQIPNSSRQGNQPGSSRSKIGTLFVFASNIATIMLVFTAAISPSTVKRLDWISVDLPLWVYFCGGIFFVLNAVWGLLAALFNPNYTPCFHPMKKQFLLATRGPYAVVRHPRYVGEAWLNVILFMFTGIWLPLLGLLGWIAIYDQARAEEEILMMLAGEKYEKYRQRTGMFFPRLKGIH